jgi:hypothetical protein
LADLHSVGSRLIEDGSSNLFYLFGKIADINKLFAETTSRDENPLIKSNTLANAKELLIGFPESIDRYLNIQIKTKLPDHELETLNNIVRVLHLDKIDQRADKIFTLIQEIAQFIPGWSRTTKTWRRLIFDNPGVFMKADQSRERTQRLIITR